MAALNWFTLYFVLKLRVILSDMLASSFDIYCTSYNESKWFLTFWVLLTAKFFIHCPPPPLVELRL